MQFKLRFDAISDQLALKATQSFKNFLQLDHHEEVRGIEQEREVLRSTEAGGLLEAALKVDLSDKMAIDFVRTIGTWVKQPTSGPLSLTIELPTGIKLTLQGEELAKDGGETLYQLLQTLRQEEAFPKEEETPFDVVTFRSSCKKLIAATRTERVFLLLNKHLEQIGFFWQNDIILLENQWNQAEKDYLFGRGKKEDLEQVRTRINYALLKILDEISPEE